MQSEAVRESLRKQGIDPDKMTPFSGKNLRKLHNNLVGMLRDKLRERGVSRYVDDPNKFDRLYEVLLVGGDDDPAEWCTPQGDEILTTVGQIRKHLRMSVEVFCGLDYKTKTKVTERLTRRLIRHGGTVIDVVSKYNYEDDKEARTALYESLIAWNAGTLTMEKPQGSSLHHVVEYGRSHGMSQALPGILIEDKQIVVVENEWLVPQMEGEWRLPFESMCWEFRISGVRVLVFTRVEGGVSLMFLLYGRDGHWVPDKYLYEIGHAPTLSRGVDNGIKANTQSHEFHKAAGRVHDVIRATCIMLEAEITERVEVSAPRKLAERRVREGRTPPRDHYVVRLLGRAHRAHATSRGGNHVGDARAPQRGHWRKGTWVHYDDMESGAEKYADAGGFWHSRTWRKWHFAGDPNNIIHKEYRV